MEGPSQSEGDDSFVANINIIPLVDVVLVLLIIFMVTSAFARDAALKLELPKGSNAQNLISQPPLQINVSVDNQGGITVVNMPVTLDKLGAKIDELSSGRKIVLVLRGERRTIYGKMMPVLDELSRTGKPITLALQPDSGK